MHTIKLLRDTAHGAKGAVLRVWQSGPVKRGMVDAQRAAQWVKDGIAADPEKPTRRKASKKKAAVKRGRKRKAG